MSRKRVSDPPKKVSKLHVFRKTKIWKNACWPLKKQLPFSARNPVCVRDSACFSQKIVQESACLLENPKTNALVSLNQHDRAFFTSTSACVQMKHEH